MYLLLALAALAPLAGTPAAAAPALSPTHAPTTQATDCAPAWSALLPSLVQGDGTVRYGLLAGGAPAAAFAGVVRCVETADTRSLRTDRAKLAFWLNAYNVLMTRAVVERPRTTDVLAEKAFFFETPRAAGGTRASLDAIENVILRRQRGAAALAALGPARLDPRVHVGLNCGARSCPRLRRVAFTEANVDAELDAAMREWTGSPAFARVDARAVVFSSLLDWFGPDFDGPTGKAGDYLLRFVPATRPGYARVRAALAGRTAAGLKADPTVRFAYDWTLARAR